MTEEGRRSVAVVGEVQSLYSSVMCFVSRSCCGRPIDDEAAAPVIEIRLPDVAT
jgi:hypothetical protein